MKKNHLFGILFFIIFIFSCSDNDETEMESTENASLVSITIEGQEIIFDDVRIVTMSSSTEELPYRIAARKLGTDTAFIFSFQTFSSGTTVLNGELFYEDKLFQTLGNDIIIPEITLRNNNKLEGNFDGNIYRNGRLDEESLNLENGKFDLFLN